MKISISDIDIITKKIIKKIDFKSMTKDRLLYYMLDQKKKRHSGYRL